MSERLLPSLARPCWPIYSLPPPTIDTGRWVTVTYPASRSTVLSVRSDGTTTVKPEGAAGPGEFALLQPDRLVYAPRGAAGSAFLVPWADHPEAVLPPLT
jgi:hypothetical protein